MFDDKAKKRMQSKKGKLRLVNLDTKPNEVTLFQKVVAAYPWVVDEINNNPQFFDMIVFIMSQTSEYALDKLREFIDEQGKVDKDESTD